MTNPATAFNPDLPVRLKDCQPLACGVQRLIYPFPGHSELVIKVLRPDYVEARIGPNSRLASRLRSCRQYHVFLREVKEYMAACARSEAVLPLLPPFVGLVQTDQGLGMVERKICDQKGELAPTLSDLIGAGHMSQDRVRLLEELMASLMDSSVVLNDLHPENILLSTAPDGSERFVLVDGIGSATFLPVKGMVRLFNTWSKRRQTQRLLACVPQIAP
jgi:hypothetical protein